MQLSGQQSANFWALSVTLSVCDGGEWRWGTLGAREIWLNGFMEFNLHTQPSGGNNNGNEIRKLIYISFLM